MKQILLTAFQELLHLINFKNSLHPNLWVLLKKEIFCQGRNAKLSTKVQSEQGSPT